MSELKSPSEPDSERRNRTSLRTRVVAGLVGLGLIGGGAAVALHKPQEIAGTPVAASNEHVLENDATQYVNSPERNDKIQTAVNKYSRKIVDYANQNPNAVQFNDGAEEGDGRGVVTASVDKNGKHFTFQTTVKKTEDGYAFGASDGTEMVRVDSVQAQGDSTVKQSASYSREFWGDGYNPYNVEFGVHLAANDGSGSGQGNGLGSGPAEIERRPDTTTQESLEAEAAVAAALDNMTNEAM